MDGVMMFLTGIMGGIVAGFLIACMVLVFDDES